MDCRSFRKNHLAYADGALSDIEIAAMHRHLGECALCARHDTTVRRGLLIARNLPVIQPSADFTARLNAKLREARAAARPAVRYRGPGFGTFAAAAASVVAVGYLAAVSLDWTAPPRDLAFAPVVTMRVDPAPWPLASPAIVASVATGMPVWPAALLAEQGPMHFAAAEMHLASWGP